MRPLQLRGSPSPNIAQSKGHAGRTTDPGVAVDDDPCCVRPIVDKISDSPCVVLREENIRRVFLFQDVSEVQSEDRCEILGQLCRIRTRIRDRNAYLLAARVVALGILSGEHHEFGNMLLSLGHASPTLPPLRRDGQVAHDYV